MPKTKMRAAWLWMLAGGVFLCNPMVAFVDVLPDVIGFAMLLVGLWRVGELSPRLYTARQGVLKMLAAAAGLLLCEYLVFFVLTRNTEEDMNKYEQPMLLLLGSAAYAVFLFLFWLPTLQELFAGLDALLLRHGGRAAGTDGRSPSERMARRSTVFFLVLPVLAILPELSLLTSFEKDAGNPLFRFDWYRFVPLFRILAVAIAVGFALWWLIGYARFWLLLSRDRAWNDALERRYTEEVLTDAPRTAQRRRLFITILIATGAIASLRLKINYVSVFPSILTALGIGGGLWMLEGRAPRRFVRACLIALSVASLTGAVINLTYLRRHLPVASAYETGAYWHYLALRAVEAVEAVLILAAFWILFRSLSAWVKNTVRVTYEGDDALSARATARLQKSFATRLLLLRVGAVVVCLGNVVYAILQLQYPWLWFLNFLLTGAELGMLLSFHSALTEQRAFYSKNDAEWV